MVDPRIEPDAWLLAGVSVVFEVGYLALLATAYARAPMAVVYPIARGSAPVFVLLVGAVVLGQPTSALGAVGVVLVVTGIALVHGLGEAAQRRDLLLALAVGGCIAGYTLVDAVGVRHASPLAYIEVTQAAIAVVSCASVARVHGVGALRAVLDLRTTAVGIGSVLAYGLVLVALTRAPAAPVAAVRETSVVMAVLILAVTGKERITAARLAGAVLVCSGVACVVA